MILHVRKSSAHPTPDDHGFTVVELLLSFVIVALVLTLLPGTLRLNKRVWEAQEIFDKTSAHQSFDRYVDRRLTTAREIFDRTETGAVKLRFDGTPDRIKFVAPARSGPAAGGLYNFEFSLSNPTRGRGRVLTLRQLLFRHESQNNPDDIEAKRTVPGAIKQLRFRYFGTMDEGQVTGWSPAWQNRQTLPDMVEISILGERDPTLSRTRSVRLRFAPPKTASHN